MTCLILKIQIWLHTYARKGVKNEYSRYLKTDFTYANQLKSTTNKDRYCLSNEANDHIVYYEQFFDIGEAIAREKQIKAGSRQKKLDLIQEFNPEWKDLYSDF